MKKLKFIDTNKFLFILFAFLLITNFNCKKVDAALDFALNFEGIFKTSNGWEVTLSESPNNGIGNNKIGAGTFTKAGTAMPLFALGLGDKIFSSMKQIDDNTWEGMVAGSNFNIFLGGGKVTISGNVLTVTPNSEPSYTLTKVAGSSSGGGSGSGGGTAGSTQVLLNQCVTGTEGDKKIFRIDVPANVKKMEIKTFEEAPSCDRNTADLFVRKGSDPTVTKTPTYKWDADCWGIQPNRQDEVCTFTNPAAGPWSIMLFGYNTYFYSKLKVTLTY